MSHLSFSLKFRLQWNYHLLESFLVFNALFGCSLPLLSTYAFPDCRRDLRTLVFHRCQHGLRKIRESARNNISRTHANFARAHKCEQNTTYPYTLSHFITCRHFLANNTFNSLTWCCHGVGVFNYYYNIMIIYKKQNRTHFDDILFDNQCIHSASKHVK